MREIKFRAWHKIDKKMGKATSLTFNGTTGKLRGGYSNIHRFFNTSECEIMQFTGLHDKNGKEIYESDYLKTDEADWVGKVVFQRGAFILLDKRGGFSIEPNWEQCEIIGNEYEN